MLLLLMFFAATAALAGSDFTMVVIDEWMELNDFGLTSEFFLLRWLSWLIWLLSSSSLSPVETISESILKKLLFASLFLTLIVGDFRRLLFVSLCGMVLLSDKNGLELEMTWDDLGVEYWWPSLLSVRMRFEWCTWGSEKWGSDASEAVKIEAKLSAWFCAWSIIFGA